MKMRKILPLVILSVSALFILTSCDALLDAIFQKNQISADVQIDIRVGHHTAYAFEPVTVVLTDTNTLQSWTDVQYWGSVDFVFGVPVRAHYYFNSFLKLPNDTFRMTASYPGTYGDGSASNGGFFIDPQTGFTVSTITMPYSNPSDSTGHSANLVTTPF